MDYKNIKKMYDYCGIDAKTLQKCLTEMGPSIKGREGEVVTECVFHYLAPYDTKTKRTHDNHPFLVWPNGVVVDLLSDGREDVDYEKSLEYKLKKIPSIDAVQLAKMLEIDEE